MRLSKAIEIQEEEIKELDLAIKIELENRNYDMAQYYQKRKELLVKQINLAKVL